MKAEFAGTISADMEQDIRYIYYNEGKVFRVSTYVLFVVVTIYFVLFQFNIELLNSLEYHEIRPAPSYPVPVRLLLCLPILITFYLAFLRLPHWWRWWWKRTRDLQLSGTITEEGIHVHAIDGTEPMIDWKRFEEARISASVVFLPIGRADGFVFHKRMFHDEAAWKRCIEILRSSKVKTRLLDAKS